MNRLFFFSLLVASLLCHAQVAATVFDAPVKDDEGRIAALQAIAAQVREAVPVAGEFEQRKHLSIMTEPLVSAGRFALTGSGDFTWEVRKPYPVVYRQRQGVLIREIDGQTEQVSAVSEPALFGFFQFFARVFDLDYDALAEMFDVYLESGEQQWQLGLIPGDSRLKRALSQLVIEGEAGRIRRVTLMEPGGDYTRIHFSYTGQTAP